MTQDEIDKAYAELAAYENEIAQHNEIILKSLGKKAVEDFELLMQSCYVDGKIELVDIQKGVIQNEDCGVYKNIHVEQWCTGTEGDSFAGNIYANLKGQWLRVPYQC